MIWSDSQYKNFPAISAIFIPKIVDPYYKIAQKMELNELEKFIKTNRTIITSKKKIVWLVIKNPFAKNIIDLNYFSNIDEVFMPNNN